MLKGGEDSFLTPVKMVIALCDKVNEFVTVLSGSERRLADGSKKRQKSIALRGSQEHTVDWRDRVIACSVGCDLGRFRFIGCGGVSIALVLIPRLSLGGFK